MLVVGLTGGIASGKSSVSSLLSSAPHSLPLIDLDLLAREVVLPASSTLRKLQSVFGDDIVSPNDGSLDRPKLGKIIFNDEAQRKRLNGIMHPAIRRLLAKKLFWCWLRGEKLVVVDAPLLIEAGLWRLAGKIVLVYWYVPGSAPHIGRLAYSRTHCQLGTNTTAALDSARGT